jgi:hypothetical protein
MYRSLITCLVECVIRVCSLNAQVCHQVFANRVFGEFNHVRLMSVWVSLITYLSLITCGRASFNHGKGEYTGMSLTHVLVSLITCTGEFNHMCLVIAITFGEFNHV